jgi:hypothetical protein
MWELWNILRLFQLEKLCPFHVENRCFIFTLCLGCKERFAIWLSPNSCLMAFSLVASFEKCMGELVNWIVKYHFSTSSVSMKDTTKQCKVRFWPGIPLGTKTWKPTSLTDWIYTQMGCSILTRGLGFSLPL